MTDFNYLKKLKISGEERNKFPLPEISDTASLICRPTTSDNKDYFNALITMANQNVRRSVKKSVTAESFLESTEKLKPLIAEHVIVGWVDVVDSKGKDVDYSPEVALELLEALPKSTLDDLLAFTNNPENFRGDLPDVEGIAKK